MTKKKKKKLNQDRPDRASSAPLIDEPRWTKARIIWTSIAVLAFAGSVVLGIIAFEEADYSRAQEAFDSEQYPIAKMEIERFLSTHPSHGRAQTLYAQILIALGERPEQALAIFERFRAANSKEMHAWARAHFMLEQWSAGIPLVEKVVQDDPKNHEALNELISARIRVRQLSKALTEAEEYAVISGHEAKGEVYLGTIYWEQRNIPQALEHLSRVLKHEPTGENLQISPESFFVFYAQALLASSKAEEAQSAAERSVNFRVTFEGCLVLGDAHLQLGNAKEATQAWRQCLEFDAESIEVRRRLAQQELASDRPEEALLWMSRVADRDDLTSQDAGVIARCHQALKDESKAAEWNAKAKSIRDEEAALKDLQETAIVSPNSNITMAFRAWQLAQQENWSESDAVLQRLTLKDDPEKIRLFIANLTKAIKNRSKTELPRLAEIGLGEN